MNFFDDTIIDKTSYSYQDLIGQPPIVTKILESSGNPAKGSSSPTQVYLGTTTGWQFAVGDSVYYQINVPLDWYPNGTFTLELHWYSSNTTASRYIQWQVDWDSIGLGEVITSPGSSGTITSGDVLLSTTANSLTETAMTSIAGNNIANNDHITLKVSRIASSGTAPAVGDNPVIIHMEVAYQAYGVK